MSWSHLSGWAQNLILLTAGVGALFALIAYTLKAFRFFKLLGEGIAYVKQQLENNGGSTTLDKIDRIETTVTVLAERFDAVDARVMFLEEVHRKQIEVEAIVAANAERLRIAPHLPPKGA